MMNRRYLLIVLAVCLLVGSVQAWGVDMGAWGFRKEITFTNNGANLTNYQIMFTVNRSSGSDSGSTVYLDGKCESDYDDIRFTTSDGNTLCDYWIESNSSTVATIWVEFDSLPNGNTQAYLYYGNAGASAMSNGDNTFMFFDDFLGSSLNTSKWDTGIGSPSVSGSILSLPSETRIETKSTFSFGNTVFNGRSMVDAGYRFAIGQHTRANSFDNGTTWNIVDIGVGVIATASATAPNAGTYYNWVTEYRGTSSVVIFLDTTQKVSTANFDATPREIWIRHWGAGGTTSYVDYVYLRKYTSTVPTINAWGSEECRFSVTAVMDSPIPDTGYAPLLVSFFDGSTSENCTIDSWNWSFGDGHYSTSQNPQHLYTSSGFYTIDLTAGNTSYGIYHTASDCGYPLPWSKCFTTYEVLVNTDIPNADFTVTETCGDTTDTFYFIDFSTGGGLYAWNWSFGDGNYSELRNPTHQYSENGTYNVSLFVEGAYGNDTLTKTDYITIPCNVTPTPTPTPTIPPIQDPDADFVANMTVWCAPATIMFTSTSNGTLPFTYDWDVNGDYFDTPIVNYTFGIGVYTISLNVTNAFGSDEEIKTNYITILDCGNATPTPTPTVTTVPTTISNITAFDQRPYYEEPAFIPFWLWAFIIIIASFVFLFGIHGKSIVLLIISTLCYAAMAFASPFAAFISSELLPTNTTPGAVEYTMFPVVWQVTQPWVAWLLWGLALCSFICVWYVLLSNMAAMQEPEDEFLDDGWIDRRW